MSNVRRGLLADRKREKEEHLQAVFDEHTVVPAKKKKDDGFKPIRVSNEAYDIFRELKYDNRLESMADAVNIVMEVYLKHKDK